MDPVQAAAGSTHGVLREPRDHPNTRRMAGIFPLPHERPRRHAPSRTAVGGTGPRRILELAQTATRPHPVEEIWQEPAPCVGGGGAGCGDARGGRDHRQGVERFSPQGSRGNGHRRGPNERSRARGKNRGFQPLFVGTEAVDDRESIGRSPRLGWIAGAQRIPGLPQIHRRRLGGTRFARAARVAENPTRHRARRLVWRCLQSCGAQGHARCAGCGIPPNRSHRPRRGDRRGDGQQRGS